MKHRFLGQVLILSVIVFIPIRGVWAEDAGRKGGVEKSSNSDVSEQEVAELITQLGAEYLSKRMEARTKLIEVGAPAVPKLLEAARVGDFRKRRGCILALGQIGDKRALPLLVEGYLSNKPSMTQACRTAIFEFGPQSFEYLENYITEHPQSGTKIEKLLNRIVQRRVEEVFYGEISEEGGTGYYDGQFKELEPLGRRVIPVLKKIAQKRYDFEQHPPSPPEKVKRYIEKDHLASLAINAIGRLGSKDDISFLQRIAPDVPTRDSRTKVIASALHHLGHSELLNELKQQIGSEYRQAIKSQDEIDQRQLIRIYETGQEYSSLLSRTGANKKAIQVYRKLLNLHQLRIPNRQRGLWYYNLSCSYAQIGKKEKAIEALKNAYEKGYRDAGWLKIDGDMGPLRDMEAFQDLLQKMKNNPEKKSVRLFGQDDEEGQEKGQKEKEEDEESNHEEGQRED